MKKTTPLILAAAVLLLFVIQTAGTLVESIYILDLLKTSLDEKVLGILFFFSPLLLLPFFGKAPRKLSWGLFALLFISRGLTPHLGTSLRMLASGLGTGAALGLLWLLLSARKEPAVNQERNGWAAGLALAVGLSVLLRAAGGGVEYSLTPAGAWSGWLLAALLGLCLLQLDWAPTPPQPAKGRGVIGPMLGIYLVLTLVWFAFSAPAVIVRWTQSNYLFVVAAVSLLSLLWVWLGLRFPAWMDRISPRLLLAWNLLFSLALVRTLLAQRVAFPPALNSPAVVVGAPSLWQHLPLYGMLLLFPVIFLDLRLFIGQIREAAPSGRQLAGGIFLGGLVMILLVFAYIFTNIWGYVAPISTLFRNLFWLPFLLLAVGISLLAWLGRQSRPAAIPAAPLEGQQAWLIGLAALFLSTLLFAWPARRIPPLAAGKNSLLAMTYNVQQFNTEDGQKSFQEQLALVRQVDADILALQESDSARIAFNNNDYVHYFAEKLGYYAYYGPTPVTGTFGTSILSKYPLQNPRTVFTFSDEDEVGVAEAEVEINGKRITIFNVHPDGSNAVKLVFARSVLGRALEQPSVVVLGDFNLRDTDEAYQLFDSALVNAWTSTYPDKISPDGLDMSGRNRIDHIFTSADLQARNPKYVLPPESFTDHPVHWSELYWVKP